MGSGDSPFSVHRGVLFDRLRTLSRYALNASATLSRCCSRARVRASRDCASLRSETASAANSAARTKPNSASVKPMTVNRRTLPRPRQTGALLEKRRVLFENANHLLQLLVQGHTQLGASALDAARRQIGAPANFVEHRRRLARAPAEDRELCVRL